MNQFEILYYNSLINLDLKVKIQEVEFTLNKSIENVVFSAFLSKKRRNLESSLVKLNSMITKLNRSIKPNISVTNSYLVLKSNFKNINFSDSFFYFLLNYLKETGRYTLSNFVIKGNQVMFIFNDYNYLSNFLNLGYDFFGWRNSLRVVITFKDSRLHLLKMILLSSLLY